MPPKYEEWARRKTRASQQDRMAAGIVAQIQRDARAAGATLAHEGKGGLDPALAAQVFKRDKWRCSIPDCKTPQEALDLDHIAGHPEEIEADPAASKWLLEQARKPKRDKLDALHVLCKRHHDMVHDRERDIQKDKTPDPLEV